MTTDQAESGASTVDEPEVDARTAWGFARHGDEMDAANWAYVYADRLCADLERVTAERDAMCEVCETVKVWKEEHWELWRPYPPEHPWQTHSTEVTPKHKSDRGLVDALARFDATRKAAADAEEGK